MSGLEDMRNYDLVAEEVAVEGGDIDLEAATKEDGIRPDADTDNNSDTTSQFRARSVTFSATSPDNAPTVLSFENLTVKTMPSRGATPKVLLNNISGSITGACAVCCMLYAACCCCALISISLLTHYDSECACVVVVCRGFLGHHGPLWQRQDDSAIDAVFAARSF